MSASDSPSLISRRRLLGGLAGALASTTLAPPTRARSQRQYDVVIVGAGLAGLTAASRLREAGVESVLVLEARDRVGGRTVNRALGRGEAVEGGGQWVGPQQTQILELIESLGLETFPTFVTGRAIFNYWGRADEGFRPPISREAQAEYQQAITRLDRLALTIPADAPWTAPDAYRLDRITLAQWLDNNTTTTGARLRLDLSVQSFLGNPARTSLLYALYYIRSAGGLRVLGAFEGGAQEARIVGGSALIAQAMAQRLGDAVRVNSPVTRIDWSDAGATLTCAGEQISAGHVVLAMMPADILPMEITPALPRQRTELQRRWRAEAAQKVNVLYERPFWRADGRSGLIESAIPPVFVAFDNTPAGSTRGVLGAFIGGPADRDERRRAVLDALSGYFGPEAASPLRYVETDWGADPWTSGCVSALPTGVLTRFGPALRAPVGALHFAGTETSPIWTGYMEGAVVSGQRVAREIAEAINPGGPSNRGA